MRANSTRVNQNSARVRIESNQHQNNNINTSEIKAKQRTAKLSTTQLFKRAPNKSI